MNEFIPEVIYFTHLGSYGYRVWECIGSERELRIISGGHFASPLIAGLYGTIDAHRLRKVSFKYRERMCAA